MKTVNKILTLFAALFALAGCIENDIPYPIITADITAFEVSGQKSAANINTAERKVMVDLADTVDIANVYLLRFEVSNDATVSPAITNVINLSEPVNYTLTTYQDYIWTITATQTIERSIQVENQIGDAIFDESNKIALVTVSGSTQLNNITIKSLKLGPDGATTLPKFDSVKDFTTSQQFVWTYKNRSEIWSVKIVKSDISVNTGAVNAFAKYVLVSGEFQAGSGEPTFVYKKKEDSEWKTFTGSVAVNGGAFSAKVTGLEPETEYVIKSKVGDLTGNEVAFRTEAALQVENLNFENWVKEGKSWFPNLDLSAAHYWWDTGNKGANTLSEKNPTVSEDKIVISGKAAKMTSMAIVGVFAAGNIYTGKYVKTVGVGAQLDFGRPFTSRPSSLKGYYHYTPGSIDKVKEPYENLKGLNDTCHIYIALADWNAPFVINTTEKKFLDLNSSSIIAYGDLKDGTGTGGSYKEFDIKLNYRDDKRTPKYILIVASASKFGDYFTGSTSSVLYVDEFSLNYD